MVSQLAYPRLTLLFSLCHAAFSAGVNHPLLFCERDQELAANLNHVET